MRASEAPAPPTGPTGARGGRWLGLGVVPFVAATAWLVGLLPWLVRRSTQGTFGTPWSPRNDLRDALLPFQHSLLPLLLTVTLTAGVLSGLAPFCATGRRSRRALLAALTVLGAALAAGWSVAQTLAPDPDLGGSGGVADQVRLAFVALSVAGALVGLVVGLTVSLAGPAVRAVAVAPAAVLLADWIGQLVVGAAVPVASPGWLPSALAVLSGGVVGLALVTTTRSGRAARAVSWIVSLALLVLTASVLTATRYVLEALRGTPVRGSSVVELLVDGTKVLVGSIETTLTSWGLPPSPPVLALVVAVVVAVLGTTVVSRRGRSA